MMTGLFVFVLLVAVQLASAFTKLVPVLVPANDTLAYYEADRNPDWSKKDRYYPASYSDRALALSPSENLAEDSSYYHHHHDKNHNGKSGNVYWPEDGRLENTQHDNGAAANVATGGDMVTGGGDLAEESSNNAHIGYQHGWGWASPVAHSHHTKVYHYKVVPTKSHHGAGGWPSHHYQPYKQHHHHHGHGGQYHIGWDNHSWGWSVSGIYHSMLHKLDGYLGWKSWDLGHVKTGAIAAAIAVPFVIGILGFLFCIPLPLLLPAVLKREDAVTKLLEGGSRLAKNVLTADHCIERISCELSALTMKYGGTSLTQRISDMLRPEESDVVRRISRGIKGAISKEDAAAPKTLKSGRCGAYVCRASEYAFKLLKEQKKITTSST